MKHWTTALLILSLVGLSSVVARGQETTAKREQLDMLRTNATAAIELFQKTDSKMGKVFDEAAGYVVFPSIIKGAAGIGGAHGLGVVYANGKEIGTAGMTQVTVGAQLGGQEFAEVIFFETKAALNEFTKSDWAMSAQASAVAASDGGAATAKYRLGVMVFTLIKGGLMFEASVGGQKFHFIPNRPLPTY